MKLVTFSLFDLQLSDLESSLLNLSDPQLNDVQNVLDDYDKKVLGYFFGIVRTKKKVKEKGERSNTTW